jgi:hypothetical protein
MDTRDHSSPPQQSQTQNATAGQDSRSRSPSPTARHPTTTLSMAKEFPDGSEETLSRTLSHRERNDSTYTRSTQPGQPAGVRRPPIASMGPMGASRRSVIDWVVPVEDKPVSVSGSTHCQPTLYLPMILTDP